MNQDKISKGLWFLLIVSILIFIALVLLASMRIRGYYHG